jgi:hypothetical protein
MRKVSFVSEVKKQEIAAALRDEVSQIRRDYPNLKDDSAFILWFLRAYLAESEEQAVGALSGTSRDKGVDAILVDHRTEQVYLVQGKFHSQLGKHQENINDLTGFADLALRPWQGKEALETFYKKLAPVVQEKFKELTKYVRGNGYALQLYYVTTGRCSKVVCDEAAQRVSRAGGPSEISVIDVNQVVTIFRDYISGVAPAVPFLLLPMVLDGPVQTEGVIYRREPARQIESWVFTMSAKNVGEMYSKAGIRLFARNIRGYLGDKGINEAMAKTVKNRPHDFWYYNNGVTIVCDDAREERKDGRKVLRVERPQVINGQQTTRTLEKTDSEHASVLVRVIKIFRQPGDDDKYDDMVGEIVRSTNWQNAIKRSDLISNDSVQVFLERELRKYRYQYLRKRQSKSEARRQAGSQILYQVSKEEFAQAVAGCSINSALPLKGVEILFAQYYRRIFSSGNPVSFYLPRYWLMRYVFQAARGHSQRAYAKWMVLYFLWRELEHDISGRGEPHFRHACEYKAFETLTPLQGIVNDVFKAVEAFYKAERGVGEESLDRQTFFKQAELDPKFERFWRSARGINQARFQNRLKKFRAALADVKYDHPMGVSKSRRKAENPSSRITA